MNYIDTDIARKRFLNSMYGVSASHHPPRFALVIPSILADMAEGKYCDTHNITVSNHKHFIIKKGG